MLLEGKRLCDFPEVKELQDEIWAELGFEGPYSGTERWRVFQAVICNLIELYQGGFQTLAYPRGKRFFAKGTHWREVHFKHDSLIPVMDRLRSHGYTVQHGQAVRPLCGVDGSVLRQGRMTEDQLTQRLIDRLEEVVPQEVVIHGEPIEEFLVLRGEETTQSQGNKPKLEVGAELPWMKEQIQELGSYQELLSRTTVVVGTKYFSTELDKEVVVSNRGASISSSEIPSRRSWSLPDSVEIHDKGLYRSFCRGDFSLGGRHYGNRLEFSPEALRETVTIGGLPTVEVDFSATFVHLAYHELGVELSEDPYLIYGDEDTRLFVKTAMLTGLGASSQQQWSQGVYGALYMPKKDSVIAVERQKQLQRSFAACGKTLGVVLDDIRQYHPQIAHLFGADYGVHLQFVESNIAQDLLGYFTGQGIPIIPIFDSFIVPASAGEHLKAAMAEFSRKHSGFPIPSK